MARLLAASNCRALPGFSPSVPAPNINKGIASGTSSKPPNADAPFNPAVSAAMVTPSPAKAGTANARPQNNVAIFASGTPIKTSATGVASSNGKPKPAMCPVIFALASHSSDQPRSAS